MSRTTRCTPRINPRGGVSGWRVRKCLLDSPVSLSLLGASIKAVLIFGCHAGLKRRTSRNFRVKFMKPTQKKTYLASTVSISCRTTPFYSDFRSCGASVFSQTSDKLHNSLYSHILILFSRKINNLFFLKTSYVI